MTTHKPFETRLKLVDNPPPPNIGRPTDPETRFFPVRAPGPGDALMHAFSGLGSRFRIGKDVALDLKGQFAHGTHPEMRSTADWMRSQYSVPGSISPTWRDDIDHGAIAGSDRYYSDKESFIEDFHITGFDHIGHVGAFSLTPIIDNGIIPADCRSAPPAQMNELYHQYQFTTDPLPEGVFIEICLLAEDHGSRGYAPQVRFLERVTFNNLSPLSIDELVTQHIIEGVSAHVGDVKAPDWEALFGYFRNAREL